MKNNAAGGKTTKKRALSFMLCVVMIFTSLVTPAFAGDYSADGNSYTSGNPSDLPADGADYTWQGPVATPECDTPEHTHSHSGGCYGEPTCGGLGLFHWFHTESCYGNTPVCGLTEHQHSAATCPVTYKWTKVGFDDAQWRTWWPLYWGYDTGSSITDTGVVESVKAGDEAVKFTTGIVDSEKAFEAGDTATSGDALYGVSVKVREGYYVSSYRFVCGNHTDCHTTGYSERTYTANSAGNYTSEFVFHPSTEVYNHWNAGDITTNTRSDYYVPWERPTGEEIYWTFDNGSNVNYPFYILFEVEQDTSAYMLSYDWGDLDSILTAHAVPEGVANMARNASHTVSAPSAEAIQAALDLGYVFTGWHVSGSGYSADALVQAGNTVTNYGSDITLIAQWEKKNVVIYSYTGEVPEGAPAVPEAREYTVGSNVNVEAVPTLTGYIFDGWTTNDVTVDNGSFTMPDGAVHFTGKFVKDESQTKPVSYTVKYLFNNQADTAYPDKTITGTVWVNDPAELAWDPNYIITREGWLFHGSNPISIPAKIADGSVITLYYTQTKPVISVTKDVYLGSYNEETQQYSVVTGDNNKPVSVENTTDTVKVGDILIYEITVTNGGNANAANVRIDDWLNGAEAKAKAENGELVITLISPKSGVSLALATNEAGSRVNRFVIDSIAVDETVTIQYTYTVVAGDAGKTLTNTAFHYDPKDPNDQSGDTTVVNVIPQYTLTVEHYADNVLVEDMTEEFTFNEGSADWNIIVGQTVDNCTYNAPVQITVGGITYAFDDPATTDALSGTLTGNLTVKLYYGKDVIPEGEGSTPGGDGIPDRYQMITYYKSDEGGTISGITSEVGTIYATSEFKEGDYAEHGYVKVNGSKVTVAESYSFAHWDLDREGSVTLHLNYDADLTNDNIVYDDAHGGDVYTFTARINAPKVEVRKSVSDDTAVVGETLHYEIHVHNTGLVDLTDLKITDVMAYKDGSTFDGKINFTAQTGITYDPESGVFTIASLPSGSFVNISYTYTVRDEDLGKTLTNTAVAYDVPNDPSDTAEVDVLYTVTYTDGVDGEEVFADQVNKNLHYGDATPAFNGTPEREGYVFMGWTPAVADTVTDNAVYTAIWELDVNDNDIPDRFEKPVTFVVVNGTWSDGSTENITVYVELKDENGNWSETGSGTLSPIPSGMIALSGYDQSSGAWDTVPPATVTGKDPVTYTYSFEEKVIIVIPTGSVSLIKVDSVDESILLADVVFKLYTAEGVYIGDYTTDAEGSILVNALPVGDYYFVETRPAQGYELSGEEIHFTITANSTTTVTVKNTRSDIPGVFTDDHYAYIIGYPDGMVHPEGNITRAEVATIFFRLLSDATRQQYMTKTNSFADVNEGDWFNTAVSTMAAMGIVNGYPDGNFYPNDYITRAEFAAIAARFDTNGNTTDADFSDVYGHWAEDEIFISANNGWILGYPDGSFDPDKNISRAEAMAVVNRVLQRIPRSADDLLDDMVVWPDNMNVNAWYYLAVQEATNSHEYSRYPDMTEHWTALREVPDWTIYEK